jgi:hypothetical protein
LSQLIQQVLLLAKDDEADETHHSLCPRALAAATTPQNVQVADDSPKLINGQALILLTAVISRHIFVLIIE